MYLASMLITSNLQLFLSFRHAFPIISAVISCHFAVLFMLGFGFASEKGGCSKTYSSFVLKLSFASGEKGCSKTYLKFVCGLMFL